MTDREQQGREYVSDVIGRPWTEVAAALNKLELDPKRLDNPASREIGRRAWDAHVAAHRRAAEWWARNRPGVVVDPGTTRTLDGTTARCILRGACGQAERCYCARTMWRRGRVPDYQVVDEPLVEELTESESWKAGAAISYVNEALVREEMAKPPVRLAPEVADALGRTYVVGVDPTHDDAGMVVGHKDATGRFVLDRAAVPWSDPKSNPVRDVYEFVKGSNPYFHGPNHGEHFHRSEYFNQVTDPDAGTEPCG